MLIVFCIFILVGILPFVCGNVSDCKMYFRLQICNTNVRFFLHQTLHTYYSCKWVVLGLGNLSLWFSSVLITKYKITNILPLWKQCQNSFLIVLFLKKTSVYYKPFINYDNNKKSILPCVPSTIFRMRSEFAQFGTYFYDSDWEFSIPICLYGWNNSNELTFAARK